MNTPRQILVRTRRTASILFLHLIASHPAFSAEPTRSQAKNAVSFRNDVVPLLTKAGCNMGTCHGNQNGKGGFRLSLRGDDPDFDFLSLTHDQLARRTDRVSPDKSLVVEKPTGTLPHEGGVRFTASSTEAQLLRDWIAAGALNDEATAPRLQSLHVFPAESILPPGQLTQQLTVTAAFSDGTTRDVTRQAALDVTDPTRAEVSPLGKVTAKRPTETVVSVRYATGRATARLAFIANNPSFAWTGPSSTHPIDRRVFARLQSLRINASPQASDSVFLRRAYLDAIGRLPSATESRAFLADPSSDKRARFIDQLLTRPEFADFWALKWADLLRIEEKTMGEKGAWIFVRWLRDQIAADRPLDQLVRALITGVGSSWENPPSAFHRTNRDPFAAAESVSQVFLGVRLQCARCHNHPFDSWTQSDYFSLAAFFTGLSRKQVKYVNKDRFDSHQISGDEVVYISSPPHIAHPKTGASLPPRAPFARDSTKPVEPNILTQLADQLTRDNPQFQKNLANRVWFHLLGRGIVEPVDDFRDSNPPSNPDLLDDITSHFASNGLRLKPLVAWIMKSQVYQLSATPNSTNLEDSTNFSHAAVHLLPAEVLLDSISDLIEVPERFTHAPTASRATQLPGVVSGVAFLKDFGKPERLLACECERSETTTLAQAFQVLSGSTIRKKLEAPHNRLGRGLLTQTSDPDLLTEFYLAALCRNPTPAERAAILSHLARAPDRRKAWEDVLWALLSSKEFMLRH